MGRAYDKQNTQTPQLGPHTEGESGAIDYGSNAARQEEMRVLGSAERPSWLAEYGAQSEGAQEECLPDWALSEEPLGVDSLSAGADALKRQFLGQRFSEENHIPSTGDGLFDVAYTPATGALVATLHLAVRFTHALDDSPWPWKPTGWTAPEQQEALYQLMKSAQSAWSAKHVIRCTKPGWEDITATPRLVVNAFPYEQRLFEPHYTVNLHKEKIGRGLDNDRPSVDHNTRWAEFEQGDLVGKEVDSKVQRSEFERLSEALPTLALAHDARGWRRTTENERALTAFAAALEGAPPSTYRPKLTAYGWGGAGTPESGAAMENIISSLRANAVKNRFKATSASDNPSGTVTFELERWEQWPRTAAYNASAHEIGHMLGLQDEYADADEEGHGISARHQQLLDDSGVEQHRVDADTTSIMSGGIDVMPAHYVTLWEALGQMTSGFVQPKEWQL